MKTTKPLRIFIYIVSFFLLYIVLPVYIRYRLKYLSFSVLLIFYLIIILIVSYYFLKNQQKVHYLQLQTQDLQEKINILTDQNQKESKNKTALQEKIQRYHSLKGIIEEINQNLALESIANNLTSLVFSLISNNKGICILYLVDSQTQNLSLCKTKKEDKNLIIKSKQGDIFDFWVVRHAIPLYIEDIKKDFRFDLEKMRAEDIRPISSLISAPLIVENRFLGILRLDNQVSGFYTQDDLRFLATISDLGAVALENGELFQRTQDLAIHDGLTSLYTKGYFLERLKEECRRGIRHKTILSLFMLDIDYFKNYNDKFGHTAGDIVLKILSSVMVDFLRDYNPVISRFGGEEFCIILPQMDKERACNVADELRKVIEKTKIVLRRQETNITVSIGVATFPLDASDEEEIILKTDKALYTAKQEGRNRVICYR